MKEALTFLQTGRFGCLCMIKTKKSMGAIRE